ncbi:MAG: D-alanyl-D-alanine carboxypeptidase family protein [Sarcina sp.]
MFKISNFYKTFIASIIIFLLLPSIKSNSESLKLNIESEIALSIDATTNEIIFSKNGLQKAEPASITKLLTALILSQNYNKEDFLIYTENALLDESSSIFQDFETELKAGDKIKARTVMDALLITSANDMATIIAENISGSKESFSKHMNKIAKELGMLHSEFFTANGLDSDDILNGNSHYTTAYDLTILGRKILKDQWILETLAKKDNIILEIPSKQEIKISNSNQNLNINGCFGGKTGYTYKAGRCLLSFYERNGRKIIGVILNSPTRNSSFLDMDKLINYSFNTPKKVLYEPNDVVFSKTINFRPYKIIGPTLKYNLNFIADKKISLYSNEIYNQFEKNIIENEINLWYLKTGDKIADLRLQNSIDNFLFPLVSPISTLDIIKNFAYFYIIPILIIIAIVIIIIIRRKRKKYKF